MASDKWAFEVVSSAGLPPTAKGVELLVEAAEWETQSSWEAKLVAQKPPV